MFHGHGGFVATIAIASASPSKSGRFNSIRDKLRWKDTVDSKPIITFIVSHRIVRRCCVPRAESAVLSNNYKSVLTEIRSICSLSRSRVYTERSFTGGKASFARFSCPGVSFAIVFHLRRLPDRCNLHRACNVDFELHEIPPRGDFRQLV